MRKASFFSLLIVHCSLLLVLSCENPTASGDNVPPIPSGKGSFSLTLSEAGRTILPDTPNLNDFAAYNLSFTPTNGGSAENTDRTNATLVTDPVYLEPGTYKLVVNAYKDSNKTQLAAQGTLNSITITAGQNTSGIVTLEALVSGGTGTFRWDIILPADVTASMIITPGNESGTHQQTVTLTPPQASGSRTLNSGLYSLTFNLEKTDGKSSVWNELLYVYQNLESVFSFEFTDAHLSDSVHTITFNSNGGEPGEWKQSILHGDTIERPAGPIINWYALSGWYTDNESFTNPWNFDNPVIESFTLYARWDAVTGLANKLAWLQAHAQSNGSYVLEVNADESIGPHTLSYSDRSEITITLIGVDANWTISLSSNGTMFTIGSGVTLILDNNITLLGHNGNTGSMVSVNSGGTLIMNVGSVITGNTAREGGGVVVGAGDSTMNGNVIVIVRGGTFTMYGGEISGNTATSYGGGVAVGYLATFTMEGGEISGNTAVFSSDSLYSYGGGGVFTAGRFTMNGGKISDNTASSDYYRPDYGGGGVYVHNYGSFTMNGGEISDNTATFIRYSYGGGVYVNEGYFAMNGGEISGNTTATVGWGSSGSYGGGVCVKGTSGLVNLQTFTMSGGKISDNTAATDSGVYSYGGGVYTFIVNFTMSGGEISGNTSYYDGGGVYVEGTNVNPITFTMSGGEISGNTSSFPGGGVCVRIGTFTKTNGTIYGYDENDTINSNVVKDSSGTVANNQGHAVFVYDYPVKRRETTAGPSVNLDSTIDGTAGGWEN